MMLCFVFAALVVLLDQFIKRWVLLTIAMHETMDLIPGVVGLTYVPNPGAAFSILEHQRLLLIVIACVASLLLIAILLRYNDGFWSTLGLSAVLGGTIGNLVDRLLLKEVVDIFELQFMRFAIFNIADIFITLGGITFLIHFVVSTIRSDRGGKVLSSDVPEEYANTERPHIEEQIGLYDFEYGDGIPDSDSYEFDGYSDGAPAAGAHPGTGVLPGGERYSGTVAFPAAELEPTLIYNESELQVEPTVKLSDDYESTLNALGEMESVLEETASLDDYDLDALLREYGFEDDDN